MADSVLNAHSSQGHLSDSQGHSHHHSAAFSSAESAQRTGTKITVFAYNATGHVTPMMAIVKELLKTPGNQVQFLGADERYKHTIESAGATYIPFRDPAFQYPLENCTNDAELLAVKLFDLGDSIIDFELEKVNQFKPDVLVHDIFSVPGHLIGHVLGIPSIALMNSAGPGIRGDASLLAHDTQAYQIADDAARHYETKYGFNPLAGTGQPGYSLEHRLTLVTGIKELSVGIDDGSTPGLNEVLSPFKDSFRYIGPLTIPLEADDTVPVPAEQVDPHDRRNKFLPVELLAQAKEQGKKIVLFSLGTVLTNGKFKMAAGGASSGRELLEKLLHIIVDLYKNNDQILFVVSLGADFPEDNQPVWPENFIVRDYLPQRELLNEYADAFISHCGLNSMVESIFAEVPIVPVPGMSDQFSNAQVAIDHGLAFGDWDLHNIYQTLTAEKLAAAIDSALYDERAKTALAHYAELIIQSHPIATAAQLILGEADTPEA